MAGNGSAGPSLRLLQFGDGAAMCRVPVHVGTLVAGVLQIRTTQSVQWPAGFELRYHPGRSVRVPLQQIRSDRYESMAAFWNRPLDISNFVHCPGDAHVGLSVAEREKSQVPGRIERSSL